MKRRRGKDHDAWPSDPELTLVDPPRPESSGDQLTRPLSTIEVEETAFPSLPPLHTMTSIQDMPPEISARVAQVRDGFDEMTDIAAMLSAETVVAERYTIEAPIGEGGMGRVFRVSHRALGKSFALKIIRTSFAGQSRARELFYQEARLASSLAHPNIVSVIDFGEDPRLGAFMVMELLEGEPLPARLASEGRLPLRAALDVVGQVAEALHYIHSHQIVHGDIKPDNILLCAPPKTERRQWQVKLLDFGIAQLRTAAPSGAAEGTPEFIAPERLRGAAPHPSMDIYGLGVLGYLLLTGKLPFTGNLASVVDQHLHRKPAPFASHGVPGLIDERAEAMVMRALQKKPEDRQPTMAAFLYELRTLMDMLGFGRRRQVRQTDTRPSARVDAAARAAFEVAPLPMAGVMVDGKVVVANPAFARFVTGRSNGIVPGTDLFSSPFVDCHPDLPGDLRRVHDSKQPMQRTLKLLRADGGRVHLVLLLVPGTEHAGDVHLTVQSIEPPPPRT